MYIYTKRKAFCNAFPMPIVQPFAKPSTKGYEMRSEHLVCARYEGFAEAFARTLLKTFCEWLCDWLCKGLCGNIYIYIYSILIYSNIEIYIYSMHLFYIDLAIDICSSSLMDEKRNLLPRRPL